MEPSTPEEYSVKPEPSKTPETLPAKQALAYNPKLLYTIAESLA